MKKLLKQIYSGIGMGCFTFVATLFIGPVFAGGVDRFFAGYTGGDLQRFAICCIVIQRKTCPLAQNLDPHADWYACLSSDRIFGRVDGKQLRRS